MSADVFQNTISNESEDVMTMRAWKTKYQPAFKTVSIVPFLVEKSNW